MMRKIFDTLVTSALLWTLFNMLSSLLVFRRPRPVPGGNLVPVPDEPAPVTVSVLIPARNEELRIRPCLTSLMRQTFPGMEIIVMDDQSTDGTAELVRSLGFTDDPAEDAARHRLLHGQPLPEGWKGKCWACWQLANAAQGEFLIFTDADTIHHPQCVAQAVALAQVERADLLSLWPRQELRTWSEKCIIPLLYLLALGFLPQVLVRLFQRFPRLGRYLSADQMRSLGSANGQFLLFRRASYFSMGGHEAVRRHMVEDVALGRAVAQRIPQGMRLLNVDGIELVTCRMYTGFADLWEGFSKNAFPAFERKTGTFVAFGVIQLAAFILPFGRVAHGLLTGWNADKHKAPALQVLLVMVIRGVLAARFRTGLWGIMLQPFAHFLALCIALNSWRLTHAGQLQWKGRQYRSD